jgi:hypothetical protein
MCIINLNEPEQITTSNVQKMLVSVDDSKNSQIRVSQEGLVYIQQVRYGEDHLEGVLFRSEDTFAQGNGYVGLEAAEDPEWVEWIYQDLKRLQKACEDLKSDWPKPMRLIYRAEKPYSLWPQMVDGYYGPYANWTKLADAYAGPKTYFEYPTPDENGIIDLTQRKVHIF